MMYKERFIAVIKHKGKVLRERNDVITLPFGSEYSLQLKNLESSKAVVNASVDGEDVLDGHSIIVQPNSTTVLKGFMNGMSARNRFKFIKKTKEIADHRGDRLDDGIVRVEFRFEKKKVTKIIEEKRVTLPWVVWDYRCPTCGTWPCTCTTWHLRGPAGGCHFSDSASNLYSNKSSKGFSSDSSPSISCNNMSFTNGDLGAPLPDEGITVKGSKIKQDFVYGNTRELEEDSSVIILRLRGTTSTGTIVERPITVRSKLTCPTCGRKSKSSTKFCGNCGTCLA